MELPILISGLDAGAFYALIALAYYVLLRSTGLVNFAVGSYAMFSGMTVAYLSKEVGVPVWLAVPTAVAAAVAISLLADHLIIRPILRRTTEEFAPVMAFVAVMFVVEQVTGMLFGHQTVTGDYYLDGSFELGAFWLDYQSVLAFCVTIAMFAGVWFWLRYGRYGRMLRAAGDNEHGARALGLPLAMIRFSALTTGGLLCGVAGILVAPAQALDTESHLRFATAGFIAFVLGGSKSAWAALAGGLLLGLIEAISARYLGGAYRDYILLALVLAVLTLRPQGLFHLSVREI